MTSEMSSEELGQCWSLLTSIKKQQSAAPFLNPVSASLVPDYYEVIKSPTDLSSMTLNLSKGAYDSPAELIQDLNLLFQNCFRYNPSGSPVSNEGKKLYEFTQNQITNIFPYLKLTKAKKLSVEADIMDLQSSLAYIKNQLDSLSENLKSPRRSSINIPMTSSPLSQESLELPITNDDDDSKERHRLSQKRGSLPSDPAAKQERIKMLRATPIHDGYACEYCKDTQTPM